MYVDKTFAVALAAVALPTFWHVAETWPTALFTNDYAMHEMTRRDVQNCNAIVINVPEVEDTIMNECYGIVEAVDGITEASNGWSTAENKLRKGKAAVAVIPTLKPSTVNAMSLLLAQGEDKKLALKDFIVQYTTDDNPSLKTKNWEAFPDMKAGEPDCTVTGDRVDCTRSHRNMEITWADTKITGIRLAVNDPKPFTLTELTLYSC